MGLRVKKLQDAAEDKNTCSRYILHVLKTQAWVHECASTKHARKDTHTHTTRTHIRHQALPQTCESSLISINVKECRGYFDPFVDLTVVKFGHRLATVRPLFHPITPCCCFNTVSVSVQSILSSGRIFFSTCQEPEHSEVSEQFKTAYD